MILKNLRRICPKINHKILTKTMNLRSFSGTQEDYYKLLGVEKSSSDKDIKKAYKKLTLQHHPDKGGSPEEFKKIQEAYEVRFFNY